MTTDLHTRQILQCNGYLSDLLGAPVENLQDGQLEDMFTKASLIFMESYVFPSLLDEGIHSELQLTVQARNGSRIPIVANVQYDGKQCIYWAIFSAVELDKLYQELIDARDQLEAYALKLKALASNDALTGLLNRGAAEAKILSTIGKVQRVPAALTLAAFEIDRLDVICEQLGQLEGERLLKALASALEKAIRHVDIASRWSETKFVALFYASDVEESYGLCDRVHAAAADIFSEENALSLSIGLISVLISESDPASILNNAMTRADAALYISKASGGAQTVVFEH